MGRWLQRLQRLENQKQRIEKCCRASRGDPRSVLQEVEECMRQLHVRAGRDYEEAEK